MSTTTQLPRLSAEIKTTALLALPLVLGHVSTGLISFIDAVIAGHHSTSTMAAVTIGTAILWLPMLIPVGTLISLAASVSQLHGACREREIGPIFRQALWLALGLGAVMFAFLTLVPPLLPAFGIAPDIVPGATAFLHAVRWGSPALTLYFCMRYLSEGMHWTLPTMVLGLGGLLVLAPIGYVLANGKLGFPEMGAQGLGVASATMMWVQATAFMIYLRYSTRFANLQLFSRFDPPQRAAILDLLRTGFPIGITVLMQSGLFIATALLIGRLGAEQAAAHQIAINVAVLCFMVPLGVAEATTVRVGHAVGRGEPGGVQRAAKAGYAIVLVTQLLAAAALLLGQTGIASVYTNDVVVTGMASALLLFAAACLFPDGLQVLSAGVLRGMKDTKVPMYLAIVSYWCVGMPIGAGLGLGMGMGAQGMWIGMITGLACAGMLLAWRLRWRMNQSASASA